MRRHGGHVFKFANDIPRERWSQAYDEGRRYGHMTTNLAEAINSVLKGTRHLPIASIVWETYFRLGKVWCDKGKEVNSQINRGQIWSKTIQDIMIELQAAATSMRVRTFDPNDAEFTVEAKVRGEHKIFRVNLHGRWCDCGRFQAFRYPCSHAHAACMHVNLDPYTFVDECFCLQTMSNIYRTQFKSIPNQDYWPTEPIHEEWLPNPDLRRKLKGRPCSSRIHTNMDDPDEREGVRVKHCSLCHGADHTRPKCPNRSHYQAGPSS